MGKIRGFRLGYKLVKMFKWVIHKKPKSKSYPCLNPPCRTTKLAISKLCNWINSMKKGLCFSKPVCDYLLTGQDRVEIQRASVPKGHLAVYVGEKEDDAHRVLVPVIYFNHPLFVGLLRESEEIYRFDYPGGIQIPCQISEFEIVQKKIATTSCSGNCYRRRSCYFL